jgi:predicted nicotinamide N-methyase
MDPTRPFPAVPPAIAARYDAAFREVRSGFFRWSILSVNDTNSLVDAISPARFAVDERLPYWADLWCSSVTLAGDLRARPAMAGMRVLELGCGLGLAGIAAAQAGGAVTLTDYEEDALLFARCNVQANLTLEEQTRVKIMPMDWRTTGGDATYDLVIGADIVYERVNFPPILSLLRRAVRPGGVVLIADPDRSLGRDFLREAGENGFHVTSRRSREEHGGRTTNVVISELKAPAS